jgi:hypothetical protein
MLILGGILGVLLGSFLAGGLIGVSGLPVFGPAGSIVAAILATGPAGVFSQVVSPIVILFAAGLGLLVATIFVYAGAAISVLGFSPPSGSLALPASPGELFCRGILIGMASSVNFLVMSAIPHLSIVAGPVVIITLLALIAPIAGNRFYQRVLGALGWILPLNYLMLPLGVLVFLITAPFALASPTGSVRWDWLTWTIETAGGAALAGLNFPGGFNIGNFTFIAPGVTTSPAFTTGVSAHETGHTLNGGAFGGFFYWIGAMDENILPLSRGPAAYSEQLAESHFNGQTGNSFIPMW